MGAAASVQAELKKPIDASDVATPRGESALAEVKRLRALLAEESKTMESKGGEEAAASTVTTKSKGEPVEATATRLAEVYVPEAGADRDALRAALVEALPGLNRCFAKRLPALVEATGREIYKMLDLSVLTTFQAPEHGGCGAAGLPADVAEELGRLKSAESRALVTSMLLGAHRPGGWFPKIGQGLAKIFVQEDTKGKRPAERAYEQGCRMFNNMDPAKGLPTDGLHDQKALAAELKGKDMSKAVYMSLVRRKSPRSQTGGRPRHAGCGCGVRARRARACVCVWMGFRTARLPQ